MRKERVPAMTNISTESGATTGNAADSAAGNEGTHAAVSEGSTVLEAAALAEDTIALVRHWLTEAAKVPVDASAEQLAGVLKDPNGLDFTVGFVDGVIRPEDLQVAARNLAALAPNVPAFLPWYMRCAVRLGGTLAPVAAAGGHPGRPPRAARNGRPPHRRCHRRQAGPGHRARSASDGDQAQRQPPRRGRARRARGRPPARGHAPAARPRRRRLRLDQGLLDGRPALRLGLRRGRRARRREAHPALRARGRRRRAPKPSSSTWTWRSTGPGPDHRGLHPDPGPARVPGPRGRHRAAGLPAGRAARHDPAAGLGRRPPRRGGAADQGPRRQGRQPADGAGRSVPARLAARHLGHQAGLGHQLQARPRLRAAPGADRATSGSASPATTSSTSPSPGCWPSSAASRRRHRVRDAARHGPGPGRSRQDATSARSCSTRRWCTRPSSTSRSPT